MQPVQLGQVQGPEHSEMINSLNTTYTPVQADKAAVTVTITLTTSGSGSCLAATDQMIITITPAPTAMQE